jgi:hypothetical protein
MRLAPLRFSRMRSSIYQRLGHIPDPIKTHIVFRVRPGWLSKIRVRSIISVTLISHLNSGFIHLRIHSTRIVDRSTSEMDHMSPPDAIYGSVYEISVVYQTCEQQFLHPLLGRFCLICLKKKIYVKS